LKLVFGLLVAIDVSLIAWLAQNYLSAASVLVVSGFVAVVVITSVGVWVNRAAIKRFEQLEKE
jgi:hypothetical protein